MYYPYVKNLSRESIVFTHSVQAGRRQQLINGVTERLIGKHGRWKSGYSRDRYLKDNKDKRLSVTLPLGL